MYTPEVRKKWDKVGVIELINIEEPTDDVCMYYMCNHAPWPFTNRDFLEMRYKRKRENGDIEAFFCNHSDTSFKAPYQNCVRAVTHVGG